MVGRGVGVVSELGRSGVALGVVMPNSRWVDVIVGAVARRRTELVGAVEVCLHTLQVKGLWLYICGQTVSCPL